jgi:2-polyprenyl-3-methyl-5-hydroxy-6-metoxy-1,4-benzoquinol methylase
MLRATTAEIEEKNKQFYDNLYGQVDIRSLVDKVRDLDRFLSDAIKTDTSWHGLYFGGWREKLKGRKVLELGAGDGLNALVMAALGADVVAVDLSESTPLILREAAGQLGLLGRVSAFAGNFLEMTDFGPNTFDFVVGKAVLHHLDYATEADFLRKTAAVLKRTGEARFFEPATNSAFLDQLRYVMPVPGRPSLLARNAFRAWKEADPHPIRSNSSAHFRKAASKDFASVEVGCIGCIERLHRLLPKGSFNRSFRRSAFRLEKLLPRGLNDLLARSQVIICREPKTLQ